MVPLTNARFATDAANARWGSLYDALYGTDVIPTSDGMQKGSSYNPARAPRWSAALAHSSTPTCRSTAQAMPTSRPTASTPGLCAVVDGEARRLADPAQYLGHRGNESEPEALLLVHHGLHVEIQGSTAKHPVGACRTSRACETSCSKRRSPTIMDLEDAVSAVDDGRTRWAGYRNWLEADAGSLTAGRDGSPSRWSSAGLGMAIALTLTPAGTTVTLPGTGAACRLTRRSPHVSAMRSSTAPGRPDAGGVLDALVTGPRQQIHDVRRD